MTFLPRIRHHPSSSLSAPSCAPLRSALPGGDPRGGLHPCQSSLALPRAHRLGSSFPPRWVLCSRPAVDFGLGPGRRQAQGTPRSEGGVRPRTLPGWAPTSLTGQRYPVGAHVLRALPVHGPACLWATAGGRLRPHCPQPPSPPDTTELPPGPPPRPLNPLPAVGGRAGPSNCYLRRNLKAVCQTQPSSKYKPGELTAKSTVPRTTATHTQNASLSDDFCHL